MLAADKRATHKQEASDSMEVDEVTSSEGLIAKRKEGEPALKEDNSDPDLLPASGLTSRILMVLDMFQRRGVSHPLHETVAKFAGYTNTKDTNYKNDNSFLNTLGVINCPEKSDTEGLTSTGKFLLLQVPLPD